MPQSERSSPARILIIDHEPHIVEFLHIALTYHGYHTSTLADRDDLATVVYPPPALLLLDAERSQRLTSACIAAFRAASIAIPPIVLLTTTSRCAPPPRMQGAVAVLHKPFPLHELLSSVLHALRPRSELR